MNLINVLKKDKVMDLFIKTNRYYDSKLEESTLKFNKKLIKKLKKELDNGKSTVKLYEFYCQKVISDELNLKKYLNLDVYRFEDFKNYIERLASHCSLAEGFYLKDEIITEWFHINEPYNTVKNCHCNDISELLNKYDCRKIMALTRIFENKDWHSTLFDYIEKQPSSAFEKRKIEIILFNSEDFDFISNFNKITWDDKICGSIFSVFTSQYVSKVPYLRTATEFFHFIFEFEIYNFFTEIVLQEANLERLKTYFINEVKAIDIFEPHALSEGIAWKEALQKLFEVFPLLDNCWCQNNLKLYHNKEYMLSNNIIDYVRALSSAKFPNITTVSALLVRLNLLSLVYTNDSIKKAIATNLDKEIINISALICKKN